jgi:sugar/nucleoside kinase (ribokinase family)
MHSDLCIPTELDLARQALRKVEIVSPNHTELASFFGLTGSLPSGAIDRPLIESLANEWLQSGIGLEHGPGALVVRAGREGCYIATRKQSRWLPACFSDAQERVRDPTGGGNAFLGGLGVALARDKSLVEAAIWGRVAASFAIEQVGMPRRSVGRDGKERWNGERVAERLDWYLQRLVS